MTYLTPAQCDHLSDAEEENQESEIANISTTISERKAEILPAKPIGRKMLFPGDDTPVRKVLLQDAKISVETQEKLNGLMHDFEKNISSSSNDIGYTKLIEMDIIYHL